MPAVERPLIYANLRKPGYTVDIDCYLKNGGYEALKKAVAMKPEEVCKEVEVSGLRGRGGAGVGQVKRPELGRRDLQVSSHVFPRMSMVVDSMGAPPAGPAIKAVRAPATCG